MSSVLVWVLRIADFIFLGILKVVLGSFELGFWVLSFHFLFKLSFLCFRQSKVHFLGFLQWFDHFTTSKAEFRFLLLSIFKFVVLLLAKQILVISIFKVTICFYSALLHTNLLNLRFIECLIEKITKTPLFKKLLKSPNHFPQTWLWLCKTQALWAFASNSHPPSSSRPHFNPWSCRAK